MTTDNSRYEEAANDYAGRFRNNDFVRSIAKASFFDGASFAEKEAHNAAIDKILDSLNGKVQFGHLEIDWKYVVEELEKLKIYEYDEVPGIHYGEITTGNIQRTNVPKHKAAPGGEPQIEVINENAFNGLAAW